MNILDKAVALLADKTLVHERVDEVTARERLRICEVCAHFDPESRKCKVCKCYMDVKTTSKVNFDPKKLRNEVTHCPKGFWGDGDLVEFYRNLNGVSATLNHK